MDIRTITTKEKGDWFLLRRELWPNDDPATLATEMEAILASPDDNAVFVAVVGKELAGFIELSLHAQAPGCHSHKIGFIEGWYVRSLWRNRGFGRRLVEAGESWAKARGCQEMASDTTLEYPGSPASHLALGYEETEVPLHFRKPLDTLSVDSFSDIPEHVDWIQIEAWPLGWSTDRKYRILDRMGRAFLLRISDASKQESKRQLFERLKQVELCQIPASRPIAFGQRANGDVYLLLSWLKGEDAATVLRRSTSKEQYDYGLLAGQLMAKLHTLEPMQDNGEWWTFYQRKMKRRIEALDHLEEPIPAQDILVEYINNNIDLVRHRPLAFQHGDFHVGNMLIHEETIQLIDFDRSSMADPYDEFKPFVWNVQISPWFESGMINGYFNHNIPDDFFPILALYAAESLVSHIPWAMTYGEAEVQVAIDVARDVLKWYDEFKRVVPTWYHASAPKEERNDDSTRNR